MPVSSSRVHIRLVVIILGTLAIIHRSAEWKPCFIRNPNASNRSLGSTAWVLRFHRYARLIPIVRGLLGPRLKTHRRLNRCCGNGLGGPRKLADGQCACQSWPCCPCEVCKDLCLQALLVPPLESPGRNVVDLDCSWARASALP